MRRTGPIAIDRFFRDGAGGAGVEMRVDFNQCCGVKLNIILDPSGVIHVVDFGLEPIEANGATWISLDEQDGRYARGYMSPNRRGRNSTREAVTLLA